MKLDVVVPTYNRSHLLCRTLSSLQNVPMPNGLDVTVFVVDNNSKDDTMQVVHDIQQTTTIPIQYIKETKQGLSHSRNAGIASGSGALIGFIDDDEEIDEHWYEAIVREFADPSTHYIGGPCRGNWAAPAPSWLPPGYHSVIGVTAPKPRAPYGDEAKGILMGGNAVIRRSVFELVGGYSTKLGRTAKGLLSNEDSEFYGRIRNAGLEGMYVPDLIIYHYVPPERLTRNYHRRWCYWRGISQGSADREMKEHVPYLLGVPRYRIGRALRGLALMPIHLFGRGGLAQSFADELASWDLLGFIYGKYFFRNQDGK